MQSELRPFKIRQVVILWVLILALTSGWRQQAGTQVTLRDARFQGLTRIAVSANAPLTGITAAQINISRPDGKAVPPDKITSVTVSGNILTVGIAADQFERIGSAGTTISTKAFGPFRAASAVKIQKPGEPAENGHIIGCSPWTDEGWSTSWTDPAHFDPVTGQKGLYRFTDLTPNRDDAGRSVDWANGNVAVPAHRNKTMLVLFVEFPDRRAADAEAPYAAIPPYLEFLQGAVEWYRLSSYGQLRFSLSSPQRERDLGWILMGRKAAEYPWNGRTHAMFAYVREACQLAYDKWGIRADDYDMLLIMPARGRAGLSNGPSNINRDPTDSEQPNTNHPVYVDRENVPHFAGTAITAGNDLFRWGYRWLIHESGHAFGLPDLYMYTPTVNKVRVGSFFYCGGWDMMGNIAGHSTDFLAWHKWKLRWIRDDQVDVVSQSASHPTTHFISPVETAGGSKMVVVRTGLSTAYVAEFRTRLGVNALDGRGRYSGVLIYRIDASRWEARETNPTAQIISREFYHSPAVGGAKNLTGVWRPVDNTIAGYDSPGCLWQPGDSFSDPAAGITIRIEEITGHDAANPGASPYTADDVAAITVTKTTDALLRKSVVLSNARMIDRTRLAFDTNVEMQHRIPDANAGNRGNYTYVREESVLRPDSVVISRRGGAVVPGARITGITAHPAGVEVALAPGTFADIKDAAGATVATRRFFHFGAGAAVPIRAPDHPAAR